MPVVRSNENGGVIMSGSPTTYRATLIVDDASPSAAVEAFICTTDEAELVNQLAVVVGAPASAAAAFLSVVFPGLEAVTLPAPRAEAAAITEFTVDLMAPAGT